LTKHEEGVLAQVHLNPLAFQEQLSHVVDKALEVVCFALMCIVIDVYIIP
jgi:hypothetical protein